MHKISRVLVAFIIALVGSVSSGSAQLETGILRGKVKDPSGQVVPGAVLTLRDLDRGTDRFTNSGPTGEFQFPAVAAGKNYELTAELAGFATVKLSGIEVKPGFTQSFDIELKVASVEETVSVVAEKPLVDLTTSQQSTDINSEFMQDLPLVSGNYTEIVPQLPGVSWNRGDRFTFYQFNIHGSEIWGNGYRIDGASNMFSANRAGFLMVPSAIESMEVVANGIPAEFGEQYGGIIKITTKTGTNKVNALAKVTARPNAFYSDQDTEIRNQVRPKPNGEAYFYDVALGGPLKKDKVWHYGAFQWINEKQGSILTLAEPVELDFYSIHEKVTWQQKEKDRIDFSFSASPHWARNRPPDISVAPDGKFTQYTPGMEFWHVKQTHVFNDSRFIENSFSFYHLSLQSGTTRGRENIPLDEIRLTFWNPQLGLFYNTGASPTWGDIRNKRGRYGFRFYQNTESHTIKTGVDYTEQFGHTLSERYVKTIQDNRGAPGTNPAATTNVILTANTFSDPSVRNRQVGIFVQDSWLIKNRATIDYGVRYDRESVVERNNFSPRFGFTIDPTGQGKMKVYASYSVIYSDVPHMFYTFDDPGTQGNATYFVLNPDANYDGERRLRSRTFNEIEGLKNPYVLVSAVGIERELPFAAKLSVTYTHRNTYDNYKVTNERLNSTDVVRIQRSDGQARYDGVEFVVRKYLTAKWDLLAHYTLSKAEGDTTSTLSPLQQQFQYGPQDWDQRHTVVLISNQRLPHAIQATGVFRYASGRPYSIVNNQPGVFAAWIDPQGQPVNRNNERMPSNWTIDLTLGRIFRTAHGSFSPSLQIINLTNNTNVIGVTTSFSGPGIPTNVDTGRLIQIGFGWEF